MNAEISCQVVLKLQHERFEISLFPLNKKIYSIRFVRLQTNLLFPTFHEVNTNEIKREKIICISFVTRRRKRQSERKQEKCELR